MNTPDPAPVIDLIEAFRRSKTMFAAVALGVFDRLERAPADAATLAAEIDNIPLLADATVQQGLHDGEDYELVYTAPPRTRVPGIRIGTMIKGKPGALRYQGKPLRPSGYDHLQQRS